MEAKKNSRHVSDTLELVVDDPVLYQPVSTCLVTCSQLRDQLNETKATRKRSVND